jgi:putative transposase
MAVLQTAIQWNELPRELGASSTVHDRFQQWEAAIPLALWWREPIIMMDC